MSKVIRTHPDVLNWRGWCKSSEGLACLAGSATGQYLENRLWRAFMAGRHIGTAWAGGTGAGINPLKSRKRKSLGEQK